MSGKYETVIGLEVHVQLATHTKIFCGCATAFGAEPNTQVCPVCLGLPGALPVLNKKAFEYAIKVAIALGCDTQKTVKFDRKNYYYPDLPKNYQISQFDKPFAFRGSVVIALPDGQPKKIGVTRVHMEEDAGKLLHDPAQTFSYVDLNRTGMPLLEIVSEPEISSPEEAYEYLVNLKKIIKYLGVSDCNMEEGSLRCDANVSLREYGAAKLGSKVEIKNMNSFKAVKEALLFEEERQAEMLDDKKIIKQETRLWDQAKGTTQSMRSKEEAHDYRYFPEPDLVPFEVSKELIDATAKDLPELPAAKEKRFVERYGLDKKDVEVITAERDVADFFEDTVKCFDSPRAVCNWVKGEVLRRMNDRAVSIKSLGIKSEDLAKIIEMVEKGVISSLAGKDVLEANLDTGKGPGEIVKEKGLEQVSDTGELEGVVEQVIKENERSVNDYKLGKSAALGFLVGQVMKGTKGKANPKIAGDMLRKKLGG